jgi:hypothetical protein
MGYYNLIYWGGVEFESEGEVRQGICDYHGIAGN